MISTSVQETTEKLLEKLDSSLSLSIYKTIPSITKRIKKSTLNDNLPENKEIHIGKHILIKRSTKNFPKSVSVRPGEIEKEPVSKRIKRKLK